MREPVTFGQFRMKSNTLNRILAQDPEGEQRGLDGPINRLCRELGY